MTDFETNLKRNYRTIYDYSELYLDNCRKFSNNEEYLRGARNILTSIEKLESQYCSTGNMILFLRGSEKMIEQIKDFFVHQLMEISTNNNLKEAV